jgi:apolipoprotein N-acyltransferase
MVRRRIPDRLAAGVAARVGATLTAAIVLALAVERGIAVAAGVALVPFLLASRGARRGEALALGALLGAVYAALLAHWIPAALRALGSSPEAARAGFALVVAWAGPPMFVFVAALDRIARRRSPALRAFALAAGVFVAERSLERLWWGVTWGFVGHSQRDALGVAQLAIIGGVPGISMLLVAINASLADALTARRGAGRVAAATLAAWLALAVAGLPIAEAARPREAASPETALLLLQPDIPRGERWGDDVQLLNLHRAREAAERALSREARRIDAIVLPENLSTSPVDAHPALAAALEGWVDALGIPVLTGLALAADPPSSDRYRSATVWIEPGRDLTARLDKERAIPVLESGRRIPGAHFFGAAARWRKVQEATSAPSFGGPIEIAPLLCYEALFANIAARRRTRAAVAYVNLADTSWLPSAAARRMLGELARFRAIEQRLTLVRVSHGGVSMEIDAFGRVVQILPLEGEASRRIAVHPLPPPRHTERAALLALPLLCAGLAWWAVPVGGPWARAVPWAPARRARRTRASQRTSRPDTRRTPCDVSKTGPY